MGRDLALDGLPSPEIPVVLSEFGGLRLKSGDGWGYGEVKTPEEFLRRFSELIEAVCRSALAGFCYNQLADTFQEETGVLAADRRPKVEPEAIAQVLRTCAIQRTSSEV